MDFLLVIKFRASARFYDSTEKQLTQFTVNFTLLQGQPEVLLGFDRIERAGTKAKFDFNFPHYNQDFYVGAYGFDMAGNRGKISNLVHIRLVI